MMFIHLSLRVGLVDDIILISIPLKFIFCTSSAFFSGLLASVYATYDLYQKRAGDHLLGESFAN